MEIREVDIGAGTVQVLITATVSCIGADAGTIEVVKTLPFAMEITEIRAVLTSKLVTAGSTHLIKVTDGTNDICANVTFVLADTIGTEKVGTINAAYGKVSGTKKIAIVGTAGGTASTAGHAVVIIKARRVE